MEDFFALGGLVYQKTENEAKPKKICIIFEDEKGENRELLVEALNEFSKGKRNGS